MIDQSPAKRNKTDFLSRFAGLFLLLDSRLRGNDGSFIVQLNFMANQDKYCPLIKSEIRRIFLFVLCCNNTTCALLVS